MTLRDLLEKAGFTINDNEIQVLDGNLKIIEFAKITSFKLIQKIDENNDIHVHFNNAMYEGSINNCLLCE